MQALLDLLPSLQPGADAERLFHGRGGRFPGSEDWTLDWFPPCWVLTSFAPAEAAQLAAFAAALGRRWAQLAPGAPLCWIHHCRQVGQEGRAAPQLMAGSLPEPHAV
nr:class I SAM-dependent methyltransferase [Inhella sp.]